MRVSISKWGSYNLGVGNLKCHVPVGLLAWKHSYSKHDAKNARLRVADVQIVSSFIISCLAEDVGHRAPIVLSFHCES